MAPVPDPYRLLGIARGASADQIKAAHRALAKRYHPDGGELDTRHFLAIQEAYKLLSDPLRRREWDLQHDPGPMRAGEGVTTRGRGAAPGGSRTGRGSTRRTGGTSASGRAASGGSGDTASGGGDRAHSTPPPGTAPGTAPGPAAGTDDGRRPDAGGPWTASDRDPASRSYTWSARGVPWWEDGGPRDARRPPGSDRPADDSPDGSGPTPSPADRARPDPRPDASRGDGRPSRASTPGTTPLPGDTSDAGATAAGSAVHNEFDVYSRSSGAAWSSASRAYFRRSEADVPRRGVFRMEGTTPVTGAAARRAAAAEQARATDPSDAARRAAAAEQARATGPSDAARRAAAAEQVRATGPSDAAHRARPAAGDAQASRPRATSGRPSGAPPASPPPASPPPESPRPGPQRRSAPTADRDRRAPSPAPTQPPTPRRAGMPRPPAAPGTPRPTSWPAAPGPGTATSGTPGPRGTATSGTTATSATAATMGTIRRPSAGAAALHAALARVQPWPAVGDRVAFAALAWVPLALLIAYGGGWLTGCDRAAATCSSVVEPTQATLMAVALAVFTILPRVAYVAAWGALGVAVTGLVLVLPATIIGNREPVPAPIVALGLGVLVAGYVAGAVLAARDRPWPRPWTVAGRGRS